MDKIAIIGGGLVGSLAAIVLANRGYEVELFERRHDTRSAELKAGKSINLALSYRGLLALRSIGIEKEALKVATPMYGRIMHDAEGEITQQPYGQKGQCIYSVSRWGLNKVLLNFAEKHHKIKLHFDEHCNDVSLSKNTLYFTNTVTGEQTNRHFDRIIGADGAYSVIRQKIMKSERFNFSQSYLDHGYKELNMPPNKEGNHKMNPNGLHIWPRGKFMLIALPNLDGSFTCTLFLPFEGDLSFEQLKTEKQVLTFFETQFPDALKLMPAIADDFFRNPTSTLVTIKCNPWSYKDNILLIGDAAHAIVPFYGQGMNAGFEDVYMLDRLLDDRNDNWENLFKLFSEQRIPNSNAISELGIQNYVEMRDATANPMFLLRKKIERKLAEKFPEIWKPLYSLVTFSNIPYHKALELGTRQNKIMDKIMLLPNIEERWDSEEIAQEMMEHLLHHV